MSVTVAESGAPLLGNLRVPGGQKLFLLLGVALVAAVMTGVWMWGQQPDYKVLFSNVADRDGGAIVAALEQMNVPHKYSEGGGAILVPADKVYDVRLRLAAQGLPKGGNLGFELLENQKFGTSQFLEQVNYQRALEGELARSIQTLSAVQGARVHLAMPKSSVFVRDQQKPTASVLLSLFQGRSLDRAQVSAIVHLVGSSVPDLPPQNVTVVDQTGALISDTGNGADAGGLDPQQLKYVHALQMDIIKRVESIVAPMVGADNVHAEATADVDFSHREQAAEIYTPNQKPDAMAVRSQQSSESQNANGAGAGGVPGALSNQPPSPSTAPINAPAPAPAPGANPAAPATAAAAPATPPTPTSTSKDSTVNYEVDKTVSYSQQPKGGIKRLTVAVVVNYRRELDKAGKVTLKPLTEIEKTQITELVKQAMGFNADRGDSLNVVNSQFAREPRETLPELPIWKQPETLQTGKEVGRYVLIGGVLFYLFFWHLRPMLRRLGGKDARDAAEDAKAVAALAAPVGSDGEPLVAGEDTEIRDGVLVRKDDPPANSYLANLTAAKQIAKSDPKVVASVVKNWVGGND